MENRHLRVRQNDYATVGACYVGIWDEAPIADSISLFFNIHVTSLKEGFMSDLKTHIGRVSDGEFC